MREYVELNIDGLVGPTHMYGGLSFGNLASMAHQGLISSPKKAALEGLNKMKTCLELGVPQAVFPPHERPCLSMLRTLGFSGSDHDLIERAIKADPDLFLACCSASSMWMANAAVVTPSCDSKDEFYHITPANLSHGFHRSLEAPFVQHVFKKILGHNDQFKIHDPIPACFPDEGAANHTRFYRKVGERGIHLLVYGKKKIGTEPSTKYPFRQSLEASNTIKRTHQLEDHQVVLAAQNPIAVEKGAFHNDVISTGHGNLFLCHEYAFENQNEILNSLRYKMEAITKTNLNVIEIKNEQFPIEQAVASYFFNLQCLPLKNNKIHLLLPIECKENSTANQVVNYLIKADNPIQSCGYVDVRQSMLNGGGPACLRLRVPIEKKMLDPMKDNLLLTPTKLNQLYDWVCTHYRDILTLEDLYDPNFLDETRDALNKLTDILNLGHIYPFQIG